MPYYPEKTPEASGDEQKPTKRTEKRNRLLCLSLLCVSFLLILYGSVRMIRYFADLNASRETSRQLREIREQETPEAEIVSTPEPSAFPMLSATAPPENPEAAEFPADEAAEEFLPQMTYPDNPGLKMSDRFKNLRKQSKYIVGWIRFDQVDEAVAQKDDQFFLDHDAMGKKNSNGAIFLDSGIFLTTRPYTLFLYGHNMKSGNMFGRLKKYKENAYFYQHRIITFDTLYEDGQYAVFAVMEMNTVPGTALWYDLWALNTDRTADREEAIRILERRSVISSGLDVQADDQLLLLVTCLDGDTERLVVAARRLREGEQADQLQIKKQSDGNH